MACSSSNSSNREVGDMVVVGFLTKMVTMARNPLAGDPNRVAVVSSSSPTFTNSLLVFKALLPTSVLAALVGGPVTGSSRAGEGIGSRRTRSGTN
jgi:hypothetical protein